MAFVVDFDLETDRDLAVYAAELGISKQALVIMLVRISLSGRDHLSVENDCQRSPVYPNESATHHLEED
jgi:hypothetical protein